MNAPSLNKPLSLACLTAVALATCATSLQATVVLSPASTWEYTFTDPTGNATWNTTTGGWTTGLAPFGNNTGAGDGFDYNTFWGPDGADGDDLWVRVAVDLTGYDLSTIEYDLGVDNGFSLYVNGLLLAGNNAEGYTFRWEYSGAVSSGLLTSGVNVFALALEDHGGLTAFDMQLRGDRIPVGVPDGGSAVLLLGLATLGLGFVRGRQ